MEQRYEACMEGNEEGGRGDQLSGGRIKGQIFVPVEAKARGAARRLRQPRVYVLWPPPATFGRPGKTPRPGPSRRAVIKNRPFRSLFCCLSRDGVVMPAKTGLGGQGTNTAITCGETASQMKPGVPANAAAHLEAGVLREPGCKYRRTPTPRIDFLKPGFKRGRWRPKPPPPGFNRFTRIIE